MPNHPRFSQNGIKSGRVTGPAGHRHHHHYEDDEDSDTPGSIHAKSAPKHIHNRPAINRGIAVNIAFRIVALDVDCEGYMYMLTQTGDHNCGHPVLPEKTRGSEWRAFRDDMLTRFGWGSVLSASWLQSYNWACKVLNVEVDRILVGIDTQTSMIHAAAAKIGLDDGIQDNARTSHICPISNPPTRPSSSTSAQPNILVQPDATKPSSTSAQHNLPAQPDASALKSISTNVKFNVDHDAGGTAPPPSTAAAAPSSSAGVEPPKNKAGTISKSGPNTRKSGNLDTAENLSVNTPPKLDEDKGAEKRQSDIRNPIKVINSTFRALVLQEPSPPPSAPLPPRPSIPPVKNPILKSQIIPSSSTPKKSSNPSSSTPPKKPSNLNPSSTPSSSSAPIKISAPPSASKTPPSPPVLLSASPATTTTAISNADPLPPFISSSSTPKPTPRNHKPRPRKR